MCFCGDRFNSRRDWQKLYSWTNDTKRAVAVDMPEGFDGDFIFINEEGVGVFAGELQLERDAPVLVATFGGKLEAEHSVVIGDTDINNPRSRDQRVQKGVKGSIVPL